ncbi:MAG TPA: hypothetical protein PLJ62_11625 [Thermoflexales bacterium]|nr:hypothetical protein [Thermoflexales bacterium]HRA00842.1 hypothetical protein [Thermoflexales bacterium]
MNNQLSLGKRILFGVMGGAALAALAWVVWGVIGFGMAAGLPGTRGETLGYMQILIVPFGILVSAVTGLVMGLLTRPDSRKRRWLYAGLLLTLICVIINFLIAIDLA